MTTFVGIVGHDASKFTRATEMEARYRIRLALCDENNVDPVLVSGHCPNGGVDIWAEEEAKELGIPTAIFPPKVNSWERGYKPRNIQIAKCSNVVYVIVVRDYPPGYTGMRFPSCYHCHSTTHIKSGACWTAHYAERLGKIAFWDIIE